MKYLYQIVIVILFGIVIFLSTCKHCPSVPQSKTTRDTTIIHDTTTHSVPFPVAVPYKVVKRDTLIQKVDTQAILSDYFAKYYYSENISDSNINATIQDTISENKFLGRGFEYKLKKPQEIITNTTTIQNPLKAKFFVGFNVGSDKNFNLQFTPRALLESKNSNHLYSIGFSLPSQTLDLGIAWKIKL